MSLNVRFHWNRVKPKHDISIIVNGGEAPNESLTIAFQLTLTGREQSSNSLGPKNDQQKALNEELLQAVKDFIDSLQNVDLIDQNDPNKIQNRYRFRVKGIDNRVKVLNFLFNNQDFVVYHKVDFDKLDKSYMERFGAKPYNNDGQGFKHDVKQAQLLQSQVKFINFDSVLNSLNRELSKYNNEVNGRYNHRQSNDRKKIIKALELKISELKNNANLTGDEKLLKLASFIKGCIKITHLSHTRGFLGFFSMFITTSKLNLALKNALANIPKEQIDIESLDPDESVRDYLIEPNKDNEENNPSPRDRRFY